jgi:hypothetical protein
MQKGIFLALVVIGVVLLVLGFQAADSLQSEVSEVFTGTPSDRSVWYFALGTVAVLAGGGGLLFNRR